MKFFTDILKFFFVFSVVTLCQTVLLTTSATALNPEISAKTSLVLKNWESVNVEQMRSSENNDMFIAIKELAKDRLQSNARKMMIRLNDQETINDCLIDYRTNDPATRSAAMRQFDAAANPKIISLLSADLNKEESSKMVRYDGDSLMYPVSTGAASTIRLIIVKCPAFPSAVREWANKLPIFGDDLRNSIRAWWRLNKSAVDQGNYGAAVVPPNN